MAKQKSLSDDFKPNEARYRKASQPHATPEVAQAALEEFYDEVSELRVKYQIRDLYMIYNAAVLLPDGEEKVATGTAGFGDAHIWESMLAAAYGTEKRKREETLRQLLAGEVEEKQDA